MKFELTEEEYKKAKEWMKERERYSGAIGGQFTFAFTPTSMGVIAVVKDSEEELLLTDFDNW